MGLEDEKVPPLWGEWGGPQSRVAPGVEHSAPPSSLAGLRHLFSSGRQEVRLGS